MKMTQKSQKLQWKSWKCWCQVSVVQTPRAARAGMNGSQDCFFTVYALILNQQIKIVFFFSPVILLVFFFFFQVRKEQTPQSKSQQKQRQRSPPRQRQRQRLWSRPEETAPFPVALKRSRSPPRQRKRQGQRAGEEERKIFQVERTLTQPQEGPRQRLWPLEGQTRGPASTWGAFCWWHLQRQGHQHHAVWMLCSAGGLEVSVLASSNMDRYLIHVETSALTPARFYKSTVFLLCPGRKRWEGLVHISELRREGRVANVADVVTKGQRVKIKVLSFTGSKTSLSMKVRRIEEKSRSWWQFCFSRETEVCF